MTDQPVTTDEQVPVRWNCPDCEAEDVTPSMRAADGRTLYHTWYDGNGIPTACGPLVPASEETVETVTPGDESTVTGVAADETPTPESDKSGTPGLTEAQLVTLENELFARMGTAWTSADVEDRNEFITRYRNAIAAEARRPLEQALAAFMAERDALLEGLRILNSDMEAGILGNVEEAVARAEAAEAALRERKERYANLVSAVEGVILGTHFDDCVCSLCQSYRALGAVGGADDAE